MILVRVQFHNVVSHGPGMYAFMFNTPSTGRVGQAGEWSRGADFEYIITPKDVAVIPRRIKPTCPFMQHLVKVKGSPAEWHKMASNYEADYASDDGGITIAAFALKSPQSTKRA